MKIFVTDKYRIITFFLICSLIGFCTLFSGSKSGEVFSQKRIIPIYSVEREDNKISVTFDCAWGADDIDSIIETLKKKKRKTEKTVRIVLQHFLFLAHGQKKIPIK